MNVIQFTPDQFREDLEGAINSVIQKIRGDDLNNWDEDYITRELLYEYRQRFRNLEIKTGGKVIRLTSEAYKLSGKFKAEPRFGDIALIIKIKYPDTDIEGVAFLEAKKKNKSSKSFGALKKEQLERIYTHTPHALLLLYDYDNVAIDEEYKLQKPSSIRSSRSLHAVTLPINLALNFGLRNTALYRFASPLSHQILARYFRGLDLEFNEEYIKMAKGYGRDSGKPRFLVTISIVLDQGTSLISGGDRLPELPGRVSYNDNVFGEI